MQDEIDLYRSAASYDRWFPAAGYADVRFWPTLCQRLGVARALELGCGTGRVTLPLARAGVHVVGLDDSPTMLEGAAEKLAAEAPEVRARVRFVPGDMRTFRLDERFDLVFVPFNTFGHLHAVDDQVACLAAARAHLTPGGRVAVDVNLPTFDQLHTAVAAPDTRRVEASSVDPHSGARVVLSRRSHFDRASQTIQETLVDQTLLPDHDPITQTTRFALHVYFPRELELLYRAAGLRLEAAYGDYAFHPINPHSLALIALGTTA